MNRSTNILQYGALIKLNGETWTVRARISDTKIVVDHPDSAMRLLTPDEIASAMPSNGASPAPLPSVRDLEDFSEQQWAEGQRRLAIVSGLRRIPNRTRADVETAAKIAGASVTSVYEWLSLYDDSGHASALIPRKRGPKTGSVRLPLEIETVVAEMIQAVFLDKQKPTIARLIEVTREKCAARGLKAPSASSIRARVAKLDPAQVLIRRGQREKAVNTMRPVQGNFPEQDSALAVVQIDHTRADIEVVDDDERLPLGRPWITLAIDVFSRIIVGIYVTMEAPSAVSVGMCICNAILPKRAYLVELGVSGEWPVSGLPGTIHSDNGKDFKSKAVERACDEYEVKHDFRPVATPHWGGHIERLMKTTNSEIHNLPGTTFSNPKERDSYDPSKHAAMTIRKFEAYLADWIVNRYNLSFHRGIDAAPLAMFKKSILGSPDRPGIGIGPIPEEAKLRMDFLPFTKKVVRREGVIVNRVWYWDEVLKPRLEQNERDDLKRKPQDLFRFDPRDMSVIHFWIPRRRPITPSPTRILESR